MCDWQVIVPEATQNILLNTSFELGTDGWATNVPNSIESSDEQSFKGDRSLKATYDSDLMLAEYAITLTAVPHTYTARVYLPTAWNGGNLLLAISDFSGATTQTASSLTNERDQWVELTMTFTPDAGDLVGTIQLLTDAPASSGGRSVYMDAVQLEKKAYPTTYIDGDQEGGSWDGTPHASTSRRQANSRAGGRVMDLEDDFGFRVEHEPGAGFAPVDNISNERATLPGAEFQRARLTSRVFVLSGTLIGDTPADLKAKRAALIPIFSPFAYDGGPVTFRYTGAAVVKEIRARYAGGLDWDKAIWRYEKLALPFLATDPRFVALGENSEEVLVGSLTTRLILGRIGGVWNDLGPPHASGTYTNIRDIKPGPDGKIYVCGDFLNFNNVAAADYIARYDPINDIWEAVGAPNSGGATITNILKMAFGPDGTLYVVGTFTNLAGIANADYLASWTGSAWAAVGNPNSGGATITDIRAVAYGWRGQLWVGGDFTNLAGLAAADRVAYYQVSTGTWTAPGASGADGEVNDIWASPFVDLIYVGGAFSSVAGVNSDRVIRRQMGDWVAMATGVVDNVNRLLAAANNYLYVVGDRVDDNSTIAAFWNGESWKQLGDALDESAYALAQMPTGEIIVGGAFENIISVLGEQLVEAEAVAYWNQSIWSPPEFDLPGTPTVYAVAALANGDLYFGYDTSGTTEVPATTTISNNGTAPASPVFVITISGGASSPLLAIENATTGKRISFSYELEPGRTVWVDLRPKTFGMYHQAPDGSGAGRFFRFGPDGGPADFFLRPGDNDLNFFVELKSGATLAATVRWVDSYESMDG